MSGTRFREAIAGVPRGVCGEPRVSMLAAGARRALLTLVTVGCASNGATTTQPPGSSDAPRFDSAPPTTADHNRPWTWDVEVSDPNGDAVTVTVGQKPDWMAYDESTLRLSGIAGWENVGTHAVRLVASDGVNETTRVFTIEVVKGEIVCDQDFGDPAESEYVLPFPVGRSYRVNQTYCPPNPTWGHHDWFAYDFEMAIGDTVVASRAGVVTAVVERFADGTRVCGEENVIYVQHEDGTSMFYVHLTTNGALVEVGDVVSQGQPIALSGDSGCSIGPHLHINLFRADGDFDRKSTLPINFLNAAGPLDDNRGLVQDVSYTATAY